MFLVTLFLQVAYVAVMQNVSSSSRSGYESLLRVYRETDQSQEKTRILGNNSLFIIMKQRKMDVINFSTFDSCRFSSILSRSRYCAWSSDLCIVLRGIGFLFSIFVIIIMKFGFVRHLLLQGRGVVVVVVAAVQSMISWSLMVLIFLSFFF